MARPEGNDYIVLPNGTRVWGLTPEWIQKSMHYAITTTLACKAHKETGIPVSELSDLDYQEKIHLFLKSPK